MSTKRLHDAHTWLALPLAFLVQCAGQVHPPGGPVDTIPPSVVRSVPDSGSVRISENRIELEFSEYVDRQSVEEALFISPPVGKVEFDWSGTEVEITFADTLKANTTYVVTVGTDVTDTRASNRMASGHTLAFSTGDSLDSGRLTGRVYDPKPAGITIFAYRLDEIASDTLDPARVKPDYVMQTGSAGSFTLSNLRWGAYRLFSIRDEYKNFLYDRQLDEFGVCTGDPTISSDNPAVSGLNFRMTKEDTTAPFLSGAQAANRSQVRFRFSEPMDTSGFDTNHFVVSDTLTGARLPVNVVFQSVSEPSAGGLILEQVLDSLAVYRLTVSQVTDTAGWSLDPENSSVLFSGVSRADTIPPALSFLSFADTILGYPVHRALEIGLSEPVDRVRMARAMAFQEEGDDASLPLVMNWLTPVRVSIRTVDSLLLARRYRLTIVLDSVVDGSGNRLSDSVRSVLFSTLNPDRGGELEGVVSDLSSRAGGDLAVGARRVSDGRLTTLLLPEPGPFHFRFLPEGTYTVEVFRDEDRSGSYSYGLPYPYHSSERFVVGADTVRVRARWSVEGVSLILPR